MECGKAVGDNGDGMLRRVESGRDGRRRRSVGRVQGTHQSQEGLMPTDDQRGDDDLTTPHGLDYASTGDDWDSVSKIFYVQDLSK